ncbi:hypothetical protein Vlu01_41840 [Micromonospora lutea]|uniref:Uncharacterized protein n=1 Tax=Micromonospora lutea TaxID=419825 RepID=A0ABQ4J095_9ACTN|nr:hypothetical protein Vlu01_41840 [Micromonospora lutea]
MTDAAVQGPRRTHLVVAAAAGVALGLFAFVADAVAGVVGQILITLTSSGFAWGLAAFLAGRWAATGNRAMAGASALLVTATLFYYLLVLAVSRRWSGGTLEDGSSADLLGLRSVAVMTALWLTGSLVAGPILGKLGHAVRTGAVEPAGSGDKATTSALAAGAGCGLLSGEGWHSVILTPPWQVAVVDAGHAEFLRGVLIGQLIMIVLPIVVLAWLATAHRLWRTMPVLLAAAASSGALSAVLWHLLRTAAHNL